MVHRLVNYFNSKRRLNEKKIAEQQRDHQQGKINVLVGNQVRVDAERSNDNITTGPGVVARGNNIIRLGAGLGPGPDQHQLFTSSSSSSSSSSTRRRLLLHGGTWTDNSLSATATATATAESRLCSYEADSDSSVSINQDLRDRREGSSHSHNRNTNTVVLSPPKREGYYFLACVSNNHLPKINPALFESLLLFTHEPITTPIITDRTTHVAAYSNNNTHHHHHGVSMEEQQGQSYTRTFHHQYHGNENEIQNQFNFLNPIHGVATTAAAAAAAAVAADELILRRMLQGEENRPVLTCLKKIRTTRNNTTVPSYLSNHAEAAAAAATEMMTMTARQYFHQQLPPRPQEEDQDTIILYSNRRSFGSSFGSGLMPHHQLFTGKQQFSEFDSGVHHYHHRSQYLPTTDRTNSTVVHPTFLPTTRITTTTEKGTKTDADVSPDHPIDTTSGTTELVERIASSTPVLLQTTHKIIDNLDSHPQKRRQLKRKKCGTEGSLDSLSSTTCASSSTRNYTKSVVLDSHPQKRRRQKGKRCGTEGSLDSLSLSSASTSTSTSTRNTTSVVLDSSTEASTLLVNMKYSNISTTSKITYAASDSVGGVFSTDADADADTDADANVKIVAAKSHTVKSTASTIVVSSETSFANNDPSQFEEERLPLIFSAVLYEPKDEDVLTEYQCELRKHLEIFEATADDVLVSSSPGRCGQIVVGQVGIRCRYCAAKGGPIDTWTKGAVNFSQSIEGIYQLAQNMTKGHLCERCCTVPTEVKESLNGLRKDNRRAKGGKAYWASSLRRLGIYLSEDKVIRVMRPARRHDIMDYSSTSTSSSERSMISDGDSMG